MANDIVVINVSTQFAPAPNNLQKKGAMISQGGTTTVPGTLTTITQKSDLTPILAGAISITGLTWATNVVTVTLASVHGITNGETVSWSIQGAVPSAYNGTYQVTSTGPNTFTYSLSQNPGTATTLGTAIDASVSEITSMVNTYFAGGSANAVYILELGEGNPADGVTALSSWITNNPNTIYSFLVPRAFATEPSFPALVSAQSGNTSLTYFFTTFKSNQASNASAFAGMKAFFGFVESDTIPVTEFSLAAVFYSTLSRSPSSVNKVPPLQYNFLAGVTPGVWTGPQVVNFKSLNLNYAVTGAEGGITSTILKGGVLGTGIFYNYWYAADWAIINLHIDLANEIINGANNTVNPLYYTQQGIDRLQARAQQTVNSGITYGLFLAPAVVSAIDFVTYTTQNPNDYATGEYDGLSATLIPQNGFTKLVFNLVVTDIVSNTAIA